MIRITKNLLILKYFSPYLSFDMKNKICFFFWDKSWISEIHRSRSKNILRGGGPPPFKIFLVCSCFSRKQRHNWRISTFSFFNVTNMALNNYGRQLIDFEPLIRQTIDQTESDDLYDYVQSSLSSNFTSLGARVMAKMKISFSYASLSGLTPFLFYLKV